MADDPNEYADVRDRLVRESERFFAAIGRAITRWAGIDHQLYITCMFCLGLGEGNVAIANEEKKLANIYYDSPNIIDHLCLTDTIVESYVDKRYKKEWKKLLDDIAIILPIRDIITHEPLIYEWNHDASSSFDKLSSTQITITTHNKKLIASGKAKITLTAHDIESHAQDVREVAIALVKFRGRLKDAASPLDRRAS
jgi:hypothetical protein